MITCIRIPPESLGKIVPPLILCARTVSPHFVIHYAVFKSIPCDTCTLRTVREFPYSSESNELTGLNMFIQVIAVIWSPLWIAEPIIFLRQSLRRWAALGASTSAVMPPICAQSCRQQSLQCRRHRHYRGRWRFRRYRDWFPLTV